MGDESRFRYRRDENSASDGRLPRAERPAAPAPRGEASGSRADDALAELARLIGDEDPFADFGDLTKPEPEPVRARPRAEPAPMPKFAAPPVERRFDDWQPGRRGLREPPAGTPAPQAPAPVPADDWSDPSRGNVRSGYGSLSRKAEPEPEYDYDEPQVPARQTTAYGSTAPAAGQAQPQARGQAHADDDAAYAYGAQRDQYEDYDDAYDPAYTDDGYMPPHDDDLYDPEPARRKNRLILLLVACVLGLVVAGVAGVFAYRMATGTDSTQSAGAQPPVIKAGSTPVKTAGPTPGAPASDGQKLIYDRVGGAQPGNERVVPREEQPVDVNAAAAANQAANAPGTTEPKKVKTLTVRADGTVVTPQAAPAAAPARPAGVAPVAYAPNQNPLPVAAPTPTPVSTVPATPTAPAGVTAAVTPPPAAAPAGAGAYVVQVSSQKSETDALGSWKVLQSRFPQLLGSYKATVKKADLGDRGIYYRAQVGPFTTREQANDLCNSLRAQGGDCLVQKN
ncbi:SPOR domain-containing protein [Azorhizobium sp. AG788]|uniref:SPOR domain-containing protein n=1 Tax=Azorhizobium sp. AG788 TaxID=2183897 RepID=UPI00313927C8